MDTRTLSKNGVIPKVGYRFVYQSKYGAHIEDKIKAISSKSIISSNNVPYRIKDVYVYNLRKENLEKLLGEDN